MSKGMKFRGLCAAALVAGCLGMLGLMTASRTSASAPNDSDKTIGATSSQVKRIGVSDRDDQLARRYRRANRINRRRVATNTPAESNELKSAVGASNRDDQLARRYRRVNRRRVASTTVPADSENAIGANATQVKSAVNALDTDDQLARRYRRVSRRRVA